MTNTSIAVSTAVTNGPALSCPSCGDGTLTPFYELDAVPVHSVLLMKTAEEASTYPRGEIRLAYCDKCGFASNTAFDEQFNDYCQQYEETQGFSQTFVEFHRALARKVIERYGIRSKQVIEIGCGKGEFLALLCTEGNNQGIGFDPSYVPERGVPGANFRVVQELFSEAVASSYEADFVCCKMTMEHIADPRALVRATRILLRDRPDSLAFFQIPDFGHILEKAAFWDVYYEHCSYFTEESLRRLFEGSGFEVVSIEREYAGQYLAVVARPSADPAAPIATAVQPATRDLMDSFASRVQASVVEWESLVRRHTDNGGRVVLWGGGSKAVAFLSTVPVSDAIRYAVDINPYRQGTYLAGSAAAVVAPEFLRDYRPDLVIVMNPVYVGEIRRELEKLSVAAEVIALGQ